jgi:hypothetical protein
VSFVLLRDGIGARRADHRPADRRIELGEWLAYGVEGVPRLVREIASGSRATASGELRGASRVDAPSAGSQAGGRRGTQQPRLFDFGRQATAAPPLIAEFSR